MLSGALMSSLAWSPPGRLASRRRRRLTSCAGAGLSPDSRLRAPWLVVRKAPSVSLASWLITFWISSCRFWCRGRRRPSTTVPIRRRLLLGHMLLGPAGSPRARGIPAPRVSVACWVRRGLLSAVRELIFEWRSLLSFLRSGKATVRLQVAPGRGDPLRCPHGRLPGGRSSD